jgi:hypothetical protein
MSQVKQKYKTKWHSQVKKNAIFKLKEILNTVYVKNQD